MLEVSNALMSDGILEFVLDFVTAQLAGKNFHVEVVEERSINRSAPDPVFVHNIGIIHRCATNRRFWLLEAKEV